jgi:hypothetical protein
MPSPQLLRPHEHGSLGFACLRGRDEDDIQSGAGVGVAAKFRANLEKRHIDFQRIAVDLIHLSKRCWAENALDPRNVAV